MYNKEKSDINLRIDQDFVIDEKGNQMIALRKLAWTDGADTRWDIRKWIINPDGSEIAMKGTGFLTEEGPHNLTKVLCEQGFGRTREILESIKDRDDFRSSLNMILGPDDEYYDESIGDEYFDPESALNDLINNDEDVA